MKLSELAPFLCTARHSWRTLAWIDASRRQCGVIDRWVLTAQARPDKKKEGTSGRPAYSHCFALYHGPNGWLTQQPNTPDPGSTVELQPHPIFSLFAVSINCVC